MLLLAQFLPTDRFEVTVACANTQALNPWCQKLMGLGIQVHRLRVSHKHDPRHYFYVKKLLKNFDLLHLHVWNPASCRYGFLAAGKVPVVITEHDPFPLKGLKKWIKQKLSLKARAVIVASKASAQTVENEFPQLSDDITIIPNGIDIMEWKTQISLPDRKEFRRIHFGTQSQEVIILSVAELHERKGQKFLIRAMPDVLEKFPNTKLVLVGDGPRKRQYEKLGRPLGNKILFLGKRKDVASLMAASDLFVLPSIREAFGLVLLEAGATGLPIVATSIGGIPEIIEHGKDGLLTEPKNSRALAKAICTLLENPEKGRALAANFKNKVEFKFDAAVMAEKTAEVYDMVLRK